MGSGRRLGLGLYAVLGATALVGCSKNDARVKTDQSQIADEQVESQIGHTQEQLVVNGTLWMDDFSAFHASASKPVTPFRGVNGSAPTSSQADWYITQNFTANGETESYRATVCTSASTPTGTANPTATQSPNSSGTTPSDTDWAFCIINDAGGGTSTTTTDGHALQVRAHWNGSSMTSGRINSKRLHEFQPTDAQPIKASVRMKMPVNSVSQGGWPAVWFLQNRINEPAVVNLEATPGKGDYDNVGWPCLGAQEIDLFEMGSVWGSTYNKSSMHRGPTSGCVAQQSPITIGVDQNNGSLNDGNYHTFSMEFETRKARFYFDGGQYGSELTTSGAGFEANPIFWLINYATGGGLGGGVNTGDFTGNTHSMIIDYVKIESMTPFVPTARNNWTTTDSNYPAIKLEAETYDGMQGMTAETTTDTGGGQDMGFIDPTDFVEWYVTVPANDHYYIKSRNAVNNGAVGTANAAQYRIRIDGQQVTTVPLNSTAGWQSWSDNWSQAFNLSAGNHWVKFEADTSNQNLNYIWLVRGVSGSSCSDMVQNGTETGIDCGGSCPACPSCSNGVKDTFASQNWYETGIDCGGPCKACSGTGAGVGSTLQVENQTYNADNGTNCGIVTGICHENNNTTVGSFDAGDWIKIPQVDMTGAKGMHMQLAANAAGGKINLHLDSPTGTKLSTVDYTVAATGGWTTFANQDMNFDTASSGVHDIYLKGESGNGICNWDYITLTSTTNSSGGGTNFPVAITNPNFDMALTPTGVVQGWLSFFQNGGTFTSNSSWGRITITSASGVDWHNQIYQTTVSNGKPYTWSFQFKSNQASTAKTVTAFCEDALSPYTARGSATFTSAANNTSWSTATITCNPPAGSSFKFGVKGGQNTIPYDIDTASLIGTN